MAAVLLGCSESEVSTPPTPSFDPADDVGFQEDTLCWHVEEGVALGSRFDGCWTNGKLEKQTISTCDRTGRTLVRLAWTNEAVGAALLGEDPMDYPIGFMDRKWAGYYYLGEPSTFRSFEVHGREPYNEFHDECYLGD